MSAYQLGLALGQRHNRIASQKHSAYHIGNALFHTVGDRNDAIKKLGTEFAQFQGDMALALGWTQDHPFMDEKDPRFAWWHSTMVPLLNEWQAFQAETRGSWWERFNLDWDTIESWQARLIGARDAAKSAGFDLGSPDPTGLPETIWGAGSRAGRDLAKFIKTMLWVVVVIVGGILVWKFMGASGRP